jgi:serine phosphatase RsbU (regulator of sigma subunit)
MKSMNRCFTEFAAMNRFATAVAATWLGPDRSLELSIAGHPRPLLFRSLSRKWQILGEGPPVDAESIGTSDLPIGIDEDVAYATFEMELDPDDILIFYTDALTEACSPAGKMLGEAGLLEIARRARADHAAHDDLGRKLLSLVEEHRGGEPSEDDQTLIVARTRAYAPKPFDAGERLKVIGKVLRIVDY